MVKKHKISATAKKLKRSELEIGKAVSLEIMATTDREAGRRSSLSLPSSNSNSPVLCPTWQQDTYCTLSFLSAPITKGLNISTAFPLSYKPFFLFSYKFVSPANTQGNLSLETCWPCRESGGNPHSLPNLQFQFFLSALDT